MSSSPRERKHHYYIMWFWKRTQVDDADLWLGCLEYANGDKSYFKSLDELVRLLEQDGWHLSLGQRNLHQ